MSVLTVGQSIHGFTIDDKQDIPELNGTGFRMHHVKNGTELLWLDVKDDEKGFAIAFKTLPTDNTGVFHILEHSVLCGSDKYPVKSPFTHLRKTSLATFLNAATATNYTIYPVASTNEQDLINMMDVYLDAVFHPLILREPRIFMQEGWHREYDGKQVTINGVVYNEMQGNLASADARLANAVREELFPDTPYRFESGGIPGVIETLSYEQFIDTYRRHYRPDNAAIVLYGELDINSILGRIDEQCLAQLDINNSAGKPNHGKAQAPIVSTQRKAHHTAPAEDAEIAFASAFAEAEDTLGMHSMLVLIKALLGNNESPLKCRLLEAGFALDFMPRISIADKLYVQVIAKSVKPDSSEVFLDAIQNGCREILSEGIDKDILKASLFSVDFQARTGGPLGHPGAYEHMASCLGRWASGQPLDTKALAYETDLAFLRQAIETDYYDRLLENAFLNSGHYAVVELIPDCQEQAIDGTSGTQSVDPETIARIEQEMADLKSYHDTPDSPEALKALPQLRREDCIEAPTTRKPQMVDVKGTPVLRLGFSDAGIAHIIRYYDISPLSFEEFLHLQVLTAFISETDTDRHTAQEVVALKEGRLGSIFADAVIGPHHQSGKLHAYVWIYTCSLESDIAFTSEYVDEVLHETLFTDRDKLRRTITMLYHLTKRMVTEATPHHTAVTRAQAHLSPDAVLHDAQRGIEGYRFLKDLMERCKDDDEADKTLKKLEALCPRVFGMRPAFISYSGSDDALERFIAAEQACTPAYETRTAQYLSDLAKNNQGKTLQPTIAETEPLPTGDEAFIIPGNTAYCGRAVEIAKQPHYVSGQWTIVDSIASTDYLWNEVRIKGGAYGTGLATSHDGFAMFNSFRDPNIDPTLRSFDNLAGQLQDANLSEDELDGYVIGAIGRFDNPYKAFLRTRLDTTAYVFGRTEEIGCRRRDAIACTLEDIHALGRVLHEHADTACTVVLASGELIEQSEHQFTVSEL